MEIAITGGGMAGLTAAAPLSHVLQLFAAGDQLVVVTQCVENRAAQWVQPDSVSRRGSDSAN